MIFWISKRIASLFGLDISKVQKAVLLAVMVLAAVLVIVFVVSIRSCFHREPKFDEKTILKAQDAIAKQDRQAMTAVLADVEVKESLINANVDDAQARAWAATVNAKTRAANMTNEQLAAELERKLHE